MGSGRGAKKGFVGRGVGVGWVIRLWGAKDRFGSRKGYHLRWHFGMALSNRAAAYAVHHGHTHSGGSAWR